MNKEQNTNAESFEQCLKCTVCTVYCPMVAVNPDYPGPKQAGPDGERYRLKTHVISPGGPRDCPRGPT